MKTETEQHPTTKLSSTKTLELMTKILCIERTKEGYAKRKKVFEKFDKNYNGFISSQKL